MTIFSTWRSRLPAAIGSWFSRDLSRSAMELVERSRVKLRSVEVGRVDSEVQTLDGRGTPSTVIAEWLGGTGPLAIRSICTCGASGICEHVIATLEVVRTSNDEIDTDMIGLDWLPVTTASTTRRARSVWIVFHFTETTGLAATLFLDSPRLRGVAREASAILAMLESTPTDDWDEADHALLRDETIIEAFSSKASSRALARAMLRLSRHPRLRFIRKLDHTIHPSELNEFSLDLRGLKLMANVVGKSIIPILVTREGKRVDTGQLVLLDSVPAWAANERTAYLLDESFDLKRIFASVESGITTPVTPTTIARVSPYLSKPERERLGIVDAQKPSAEVALTWLDGALVASLTLIDRQTKARAPFHPTGAAARTNDQIVFFARTVAERISARFLEAGFVPRALDRYAMYGADRAAEFIRTQWPQWKDLDRRTDRTLEDLIEPKSRFEISVAVQRPPGSDENWFELDLGVSLAGEGRLNADELAALLATSGRYADVRGRLLDVSHLRERHNLLTELAEQRQAGLATMLALSDELLDSADSVSMPPEILSLRERLRDFSGIKAVEIPPHLESILRPYQKRGVDFLAYLASFGFGGVLADEMGLGKTLQVVTYLLWRKHHDGDAPSLVIAPTSVTHTWENEIAKFAPALRVLRLQSGAERAALYERINAYDVVITSYALARLDADALAAQYFRLIVLDEAQHAKNPSSQIARVVRALQSKQRLALTGTPIENALRDLWAIFAFVEPGLLGTESRFRRRFEQPIADGDEKAAENLRSRLEPFLIRRTKDEVATELPERIEALVECDLSPLQRRLYTGVAEAARRELLENLDPESLDGMRIHVLAALTRLRQICAHPALLFPEYRDTPEASSKLDAFIETVQDVVEGGHRVVVFSAFSAMLKILRAELGSRKLTSCYLDGSMKERERAFEVERFMADDGPPVFLCSLKAGGVGLTLTAADYVILYDPWWNPAVERQAIDRTHRIGQRRVVTAYRMITLGTVEGKMRSLAERKMALSRSVIRGEAGLAKTLTREDLEMLLSDPSV